MAGVTDPRIDRLREQHKHLGPWRGAVADEALAALAAELAAAHTNERHLRNLHDWRLRDLYDEKARAERAEAALAEAQRVQAELAERFFNEDDPRESEEVPLAELVERAIQWGDQAWTQAGRELERADDANSRLYAAVSRLDAARKALREMVDELCAPVQQYVWAVARAVEIGRAALAANAADTEPDKTRLLAAKIEVDPALVEYIEAGPDTRPICVECGMEIDLREEHIVTEQAGCVSVPRPSPVVPPAEK